jgi:hypothetical protein
MVWSCGPSRRAPAEFSYCGPSRRALSLNHRLYLSKEKYQNIDSLFYWPMYKFAGFDLTTSL